MARLPYLGPDDMTPANRDLFPPHINLRRILVNNPDAARAMGVQAMYLRHRSVLAPRLRELAILEVGRIARSPYEWVHHVAHGREAGITDAEIRAVAAGDDAPFTPLERAVLSAARESTLDATVSDATFAALRAELGGAEIVDLVMAIGFYCGVVRILGALRIDVEDELAGLLVEFPLPAAPPGARGEDRNND